MNVIVAALAAGGLFFVWEAWQSEQAVTPYRRSLGDTPLEYKCEAGHTWTAMGRVEPRLCTSCGKPAHPVGDFWCQAHGVFEVAARYVQDPGEAPHLSQLRLAGHDWVAAEAGVHCPRCNGPLKRRREDPLADKNRKRSDDD